MFKRTNKLWKGLALVLALCMLSTTVVFANDTTPTGNTFAITTEADKAYNETANTITVAGTVTGDATADVTILAVRSTAELTADGLGELTTTALQDQVVYIDQAPAVDGEFSYTFYPRTDATGGGTVTVFVNGENSANTAPASISFDCKNPAPGLKMPEKWYEGTSTLDVALVNPNNMSDSYGNVTAWYDDLATTLTVTIGGEEKTATKDAETGLGYTLVAATQDAPAYLQLTGLPMANGGSITKIAATSSSTNFKNASWEGTLTQEKKAAPTLSVATDYEVVAGQPATITVTGAGVDWVPTASEILASTTVVDPASDNAQASEYAAFGASYTNGTITVTETLGTDSLEESRSVKVSGVDYYKDTAAVTYTVIAPTKVEAESVTADNVKVAYTATVDTENGADTAMTDADLAAGTALDTDELKGLYGTAQVVLPTPEDGSGFTYTWTIEEPQGKGATLPDANALASGTITLDRPVYSATNEGPKAYTYTLTLTVDDDPDVYAAATRTFTLSTTRVGMKGVPVTITPADVEVSAGVAAGAEFTLAGAGSEYDLTWDAESSTFKNDAVAPGDYTITIVRPGYFVASAEIEITSSGTISGTMPELIPGDANGDGGINITDVTVVIDNWGTAALNADLNGDATTNITDVTVVIDNWGKTGVGTNSLNAQ